MLNAQTTGQAPCWYVIHTHPKQEDRAESNLRAWKVETFYPLLKEQGMSRFSGKLTDKIKPLFPRYLFARFDAADMLGKISFTRGVHSVVGFGNGPVPVPDDAVEFIKSQVREDGFIRLSEDFKPGDKVKIKDGFLKHLIGIFEGEIKGSDRVVILLASVSYQGRVLIEKELVNKVK